MGSISTLQQHEYAYPQSSGDDRNRPGQDAEHRDRIEGIVHDLRSPLCALVGELEWVAKQVTPDGEVMQSINAAQASARRLDEMITHLLTVARVEAADVPLRKEPLCALGFVSEVAASYSRRCADRKIRLAPPTGVEFIVNAEPMLLRRVLENLLDNAVRHTPRGGRISVEASTGAAVVISVDNDGRSIPIGARDRIFEKFKRGEDEPIQSGHFGLGLYICRRALEAHGGTIGVVDKHAWPTSFEIRLPH